jgi:hypothetical protein
MEDVFERSLRRKRAAVEGGFGDDERGESGGVLVGGGQLGLEEWETWAAGGGGGVGSGDGVDGAGIAANNLRTPFIAATKR